MELFSHYAKAKAVELAQERQIPQMVLIAGPQGWKGHPVPLAIWLYACLSVPGVATGMNWVL